MAFLSQVTNTQGMYVVSYTPAEVDVFDIRVDWDGIPVPGN
jgi:hypothetical protein